MGCGGYFAIIIILYVLNYYTTPLLEGELFLLDEHLRVDELLGSGAYGVVCEVTDTRDGSKHAVKVVLATL